MIDPYTHELDRPVAPLNIGARGMPARRVQEWLGLHGIAGAAIDGEFGPATARALAEFQAAARLGISGMVSEECWRALVHPLETASTIAFPQERSFGSFVVQIARRHHQQRAREIGGDNCGPWVRHYCRGHSVAWCQGFASTIWADAARALGLDTAPLELVLDGIWCLYVPRMVQEAREKGLFISGAGGSVKPTRGSMFFLRGGPHGYAHVGLVEKANDDGTMTTIEGNTNDDGSANGYEVARRVRKISGSDFAVIPG